MVSATFGEIVGFYRAQAGLDPALVAQRAGIDEDQYRALELGTGWPGTVAVRAVIDALDVPDADRARLDVAGTPIDRCLQRMLYGYDIPALILDSTWCTVAANCFAVDLLPGCEQPGWSLMRWVLLEDEAKQRLANWEEVAQAFAAALRRALNAAPYDPELLSLRVLVEPTLYANTDPDQPDGQVLIWRTPEGTYPISACLVTIPSGRPDLRQVTFVPRAGERVFAIVQTQEHTASWHGPLLADLVHCGLCGRPLVGGELTAYRCVIGCLPDIPPEDLELRVAREALPRAFPPETIRQLARVQEILTARGIEMALNVPVTTQHALHQWCHSMTPAQRRGILMQGMTSATVSPSGGATGPGSIDVTITWRDPS